MGENPSEKFFLVLFTRLITHLHPLKGLKFSIIEIKPDYADAWNLKGMIFEEKGESEEAMKYYEKALEYELEHKETKENIYRLRNKNNQIKEN